MAWRKAPRTEPSKHRLHRALGPSSTHRAGTWWSWRSLPTQMILLYSLILACCREIWVFLQQPVLSLSTFIKFQSLNSPVKNQIVMVLFLGNSRRFLFQLISSRCSEKAELTFHRWALWSCWDVHPHARPTAVGEVLRAVFLTQNLHETPSTGLVHAPFLDFWKKKEKNRACEQSASNNQF